MARTSDSGGSAGEPPALTEQGLQEINRWWTLWRIVSNASHDVNNALQIISGNIEMMQAKGELDPASTRRAQSISAQAERAATTIGRLVAYSRETSTAPQRIDLRVMANDALALRTVSLGRKRVATKLTASDDEPFWVVVDPHETLQLLLNLLLVAEEDLGGQAAPEIEVRLSRSDGAVELDVLERASGWARVNGQQTLAFEIAERAVAGLVARSGGRLAVVPGDAGGGRRATLILPARE